MNNLKDRPSCEVEAVLLHETVPGHRAEAMRACRLVIDMLGERLDLRRFHNAVPDDGPLPLTVLESRIDEWIQGQR